MVLTLTIPTRVYTNETITIAPASVPVGLSQVLLTVETAGWSDPSVTLTILLEVSEDSGVTWPKACTAVAHPPWNPKNPANSPITVMMRFPVDVMTGLTIVNPSRMIRGSAVFVGSVSTGGSVQAI